MRLSFVISVALLGGCGDSEVERLTRVRATVCACKTATCAEAALKQVPQTEINPSHRAQRVAREMLDCLAKLYEAERPSDDPDTIGTEGPKWSEPANAGERGSNAASARSP